jgi:hypothetical protein
MEESLEKLENLLKTHNWYFHLNKETKVREQGLHQKEEIQAIINNLRQQGYEQQVYRLWIRWCPYDDIK